MKILLLILVIMIYHTKTSLIKASIIACVLVAALASVSPTAAQEAGAQIKAVEYKFDGPPGEKTRAVSYVTNRMNVKAGEGFSQRKLDESARNISLKGPYEVMPWVNYGFDGGVKVVIFIRKRLYVKSVVFEPEPPYFNEEELDAMVFVERESYLISRAFLDEDAERIEKGLREAGYAFAEVGYKILEVKDGIKVVFETNAGPFVDVMDIRFEGNEFFSDSDLLGAIESSAMVNGIPVLKNFPWFMYPWFHNTTYVDEKIDGDVKTVTEAYRNAGFLDARVFVQERRYADDFSSITCVIRVHEGIRYEAGKISIKGNALFTTDYLMEKVLLKTGEPLLGDKLEKSRKDILGLYEEKAYINASVRVRRSFETTGNKIDLVFDITEREKVFIEKIEIKGNKYTKEKVARRELSIYPGEPFNLKEMKNSLYRLFGTGYFSKVIPVPKEGSRENWKNLEIELDERRTGSLHFGFTVTSEGGVTGLFMLRQDNFDLFRMPESFMDVINGRALRGAGQKFYVNAQPGTETASYTLAWVCPYFMDTDWNFSTRLFKNTRIWTDFTQSRSGVSFSLGQRFQKDYRFDVAYSLADVAVYDLKSYAPYTVLQSEGNTLVSSITPKFKISKLKVDRFGTRFGGFTASAAYEYASKLLGSDASFGKLSFSGATYGSVIETSSGAKHTVELSGQMMYVHETEGEEYVPVFELGFMGGGGTLRGFRYRQVGPRENDRPTGGRVLTTATFQYAVPIPGAEETMRFVMFSDAGNLAEDWDAYSMDEFRTSVGYGLRIKLGGSAAAPTLVIDFGYPVRRLRGDERKTFYFSLSASF